MTVKETLNTLIDPVVALMTLMTIKKTIMILTKTPMAIIKTLMSLLKTLMTLLSIINKKGGTFQIGQLLFRLLSREPPGIIETSTSRDMFYK